MRVFSKTCISSSQSPQLNTTVNNILTAFNERIQAKDWLDPKTKKLCEQKVRRLHCPFGGWVLSQVFTHLRSVGTSMFHLIAKGAHIHTHTHTHAHTHTRTHTHTHTVTITSELTNPPDKCNAPSELDATTYTRRYVHTVSIDQCLYVMSMQQTLQVCKDSLGVCGSTHHTRTS